MSESVLLVSPEPLSDTITGLGKRTNQLKVLLQDLGYLVQIVDKQLNVSNELQFRFCVANVFDVATSLAIQKQKIPVIVDLYTPFFLENSHQMRQEEDLSLLKMALTHAHGFLCAPGRQYDLYFGILYGLGGLSAANRLHALPFYLKPLTNPRPIHGIQHIAWIGGFWEWFYPEPFLDAIAEILPIHPHCKISFVGVEHPRTAPRGYNFGALKKARELAQNFLGRVEVLPWMQPSAYGSFLDTVDLGIVLHKHDLEATYCIRTRYCELLERQIPMIVSSGGYFEPYLKRGNLAKCLEEPQLLADCIKSMLLNGFENRNYDEIFESHKKHLLAKPLQEYVSNVLKLKHWYVKQGPRNDSTWSRFRKKIYRLVKKLRTVSRFGSHPQSFSPTPDGSNPRQN